MGRHKRKSRQESTTPWSPDYKRQGALAPTVTTGTLNPPQDDQHQDHHYQQEQDPHNDHHDTNVSMPVTKKRKNRKSKGKSKQKASSSLVKNDSPTVNSDDQDHDMDATPLEGTMMGDAMVLLDRTKGVVYSAEERLKDGTRKQVGTILANGTIQIMTETDSPDHPTNGNTNQPTATSTDTGKNQEEPQFPFDADPDDHCESPIDAYQDIVPFLQAYQDQKKRRRSSNNKSNSHTSHLQIYDPYYCNGAVRRNLESLGFPHVYNEKEDCYQVWNTPSRYPTYDILLTNPPYSGDHIERLIQHLLSPTFGRDRPWMLLLPQWVHKKDYYIQGMNQRGMQPFYLVPHKRYVYVPPPTFRESKKSDVHKKSSPFVSMWYLWGGSDHDQWLSLAQTQVTNCHVARSKNALRDLRRKKER